MAVQDGSSAPLRRLRRPAVIVRRVVPGAERAVSWRRLLPPWLVSCFFHSLLLLALLMPHYLGVPLFPQKTPSPEPVAAIDTRVSPEDKKEDLEHDEIGVDPLVPPGYNTNRHEPVNMPGPAKLEEPVGIPGGTDALPSSIPPPPGYGGDGTGGGVERVEPGSAPLGRAGGLGGPALQPGGFDGRSGATRERMIREGGGNRASEAAVAAGLKWIHLHQAPDGHWALDEFPQHGQRLLPNGALMPERCNCTGHGIKNDIAGTAFGLLPFLGAGETHRGGNDGVRLYAKDVERGLRYLLMKQYPDGGWGGEMYAQGLATIALCEAYGLTADVELRAPAQRAIGYIVRAQSKAGGWDYVPRPVRPLDTSVGGWQLMALKSGQLAGLEVPPQTLAAASRWLDEVSSLEGSGYGYVSPGATPTMTAVGLLCREYLGWGPRNPALQRGAQRLLAETPPRAMHNIYYYYYATQVLHHLGGELWQAWNPAMRDWLIGTQDRGVDPRHAHHKGSWDPRGDVHGTPGGRLMVTSMSVLTLEVYYRHLPLYRRELGGAK